MKFNNIPDFLAALQDRMDELQDQQAITSSTSILPGFSDSEIEDINFIIDEASQIFEDIDDLKEFLCAHFENRGYTDDQITQIFDYAGLE